MVERIKLASMTQERESACWASSGRSIKKESGKDAKRLNQKRATQTAASANPKKDEVSFTVMGVRGGVLWQMHGCSVQ